MRILLISLLFTVLLANGCMRYGVEIKNPEEAIVLTGNCGIEKNSTVLPGAMDDASAGKKITGKPEKQTVPVRETPPKAAVPAVAAAVVPPSPEKPAIQAVNRNQVSLPVPEQPGRSPEKFRRGRGMWRAFSRLSPAEQQELLKLQRSDPERYRAVISAKADELYEQENLRRQELNTLAEKFKMSKDTAEKENLRQELRKKVEEDFRQRLQDTRRDIESYKKRTAQLEAELQKREQNCTAIVDAILREKLTALPKKTDKI